MAKKILIALIAVIVVIQFFSPEKNIDNKEQVNAIETKYAMPDTVRQILAVACYDCHSNNTRYPWYNRIQPVAWWLASHIKDGKRHLNFDEFTTYSLKRQDHKLEELVESQQDHWMPLKSYTLAHKDTRLSESQRKLLIDWATKVREAIQADSLHTSL